MVKCAVRPCKNDTRKHTKFKSSITFHRAAFERISTIKFRPHNRDSVCDFRTARLPRRKSTDEPSDFNPYEHRVPKQPIPVWMAYLNLIRSGLGAGMLGYPIAISRAGIILGPIFGICTAALIIHMHIIMLNCLNEISRRLGIPIISYRYGFRIAMLHGPPVTHCIGRHGPAIVAVFMLMSQVGICAVFIDFTADSLRDIMDWSSTRNCILVLLLPYMILELYMKTLKIISYISMFGNILNIMGLSIMMYHVFLCPHGEFVSHRIKAFPLSFCFGTFLFNLSAIGVVISLDKNLHKPELLTARYGMITLGMGIPATCAIVFGVLGYWSFGAMEENVLRSLPYDDVTSIVAASIFLVAVAFAYPIQCFPAVQIILEIIRNYDMYNPPTDETMKLLDRIVQPLFVLFTFAIAYMCPFQALLVAFVGNLCTTMLALVFPALMDICLMYPGPYGKFNIYLIKNILIVILGVVSWIFGVLLNGYYLYIKVVSIPPHEELEYL